MYAACSSDRAGSDDMNQPRPYRLKARSRARDIRQTAVVLGIGSLLGIGLFATGEYVSAKLQAVRLQPAASVAVPVAAAGSNESEIYTGSILYTPEDGRICHQWFFENQTGRFLDNGYVDCEQASYHSTSEPPKRLSSARMRVISTGFRDH